jgi:hypothetical protein
MLAASHAPPVLKLVGSANDSTVNRADGVSANADPAPNVEPAAANTAIAMETSRPRVRRPPRASCRCARMPVPVSVMLIVHVSVVVFIA